jgi:uncharacterized membrane protein
MSPPEPSRRAAGLAGLLAVAGASHFAIPRFYDRIVPRALPGPARAWTLASGLAELGCATAVARPRTRRQGATAAACLLVAVFPANVQMALDWRSRPATEKVGAYLRLPLQLPLVWWALVVRRETDRVRRTR